MCSRGCGLAMLLRTSAVAGEIVRSTGVLYVCPECDGEAADPAKTNPVNNPPKEGT